MDLTGILLGGGIYEFLLCFSYFLECVTGVLAFCYSFARSSGLALCHLCASVSVADILILSMKKKQLLAEMRYS